MDLDMEAANIQVQPVDPQHIIPPQDETVFIRVIDESESESEAPQKKCKYGEGISGEPTVVEKEKEDRDEPIYEPPKTPKEKHECCNAQIFSWVLRFYDVKYPDRSCLSCECKNGCICVCSELYGLNCCRLSPSKYFAAYTFGYNSTHKTRTVFGILFLFWLILGAVILFTEISIYSLILFFILLVCILVLLAIAVAIILCCACCLVCCVLFILGGGGR